MIVVKFWGEYDKTFSLDVSSVIEAEFIILCWINSQKKDRSNRRTHKIELDNMVLFSRSRISMNNFYIMEGEEYLRNMLVTYDNS